MPRCAVCGWSVPPRGAKPCGRCFVLYHRDCWARTAACAIYGCGWVEPEACRPVATLDRTSNMVSVGFMILTLGAATLTMAAFADVPRHALTALACSVGAMALGIVLIVVDVGTQSRFRRVEGVVRDVRWGDGVVQFRLQLPGGRRLTTTWTGTAPDVRPGDLFRAVGADRVERITFLRPRPMAA